VRLYHCFSLSLREVETILAQRGVVVSYESIRVWGLCFVLRPGLCHCTQAAPTAAGRQVAPGRGVHPDQGKTVCPSP
jgi:putative transposase